MQIEIMVAKKYFFPYNRDFFRRISLISIVTVFISVFLSLFILGILNGFHQTIVNKIISKDFHIQVFHNRDLFTDYEEIIAEIEKKFPQVKGFAFFEGGGIISQELNRQSVMIRGIDENLPPYLKDFVIIQGKWRLDEISIVIGADLAQKLSLKEGSIIRLFFKPYQNRNEKDKEIVSKKFKVAGIYKTGYEEIDSNLIFLSFQKACQIFEYGQRASGVGFFTQDLKDIPLIKKKIKEMNYYLIAKDWEESNRNILFSLVWEKTIMFIVLCVIIIAALFCVSIGFNVVVADRKREIGILKMMGLTPERINKIFFIKGLLIGLIGIFFGTLFSYILLAHLKEIVIILERALQIFFSNAHLISEESSYKSSLFFEWGFWDLFIIFALNLIAVHFATFFPVRRINQYTIAESIRNA